MSQPPPRGARERAVERFPERVWGLFLHYGLGSLPGGAGVAEWPAGERQSRLREFRAENFEARALARFARECGMGYLVLTARHHDGFSLYDTAGLDDFDAPHSGAGRDLVAEFVEACREYDLLPILYHTTLDRRPEWDTGRCGPARFAEYLDYLHASLQLLCCRYGPLGGLWLDGDWSRPLADWQMDLRGELFRHWQPEALLVTNTGWQRGGEVWHPSVDVVTYENCLPDDRPLDGDGRARAREMCLPLNLSWHHRPDDTHYPGVVELARLLVRCRGHRANFLINTGPRPDGSLDPYEAALLRRVAQWLAPHRELLAGLRRLGCATTAPDFLAEHAGRRYYFAFDVPMHGTAHFLRGTLGQEPRPIQGLGRTPWRARWINLGYEFESPLVLRPEGHLIEIPQARRGHYPPVGIAEILPA